MTLEEIYRLYAEEGAEGEKSRALLRQAHWFASCAVFDPKTGEALPQALSAFLKKFSEIHTAGTIRDRLWRITEHARPSVERLLTTLNESPRREQALLPAHAVRELDANSFIKLSNRPGRNIREKLAGKPYLQAVRRYQSVDLPENRLLKAFFSSLAELLELRRNCLGEQEDVLLAPIHSWLRSDEARAISRWDNLPPNNTLLSHRDYRRVWDAWRRLQTLDEDIALDLSRLNARQETMARWNDFGRMYHDGAHLFAEMPVIFDYEVFSIKPWLPKPLTARSERKVRRLHKLGIVTQSACVDLVNLHPRFATSQQSHMALADSFLWQQWGSDSETVDITLFDSDAASLHPDAISIAYSDLFFGSDRTPDHCDRAARAFADRLAAIFKGKKLAWLVPDALNDFQLEIIRRNLNVRFPHAEPLPRSVAAVFQQVNYSNITGEEYSVVVVDQIGGTTCATTLVAKMDSDLEERLPQTKGFYWERCPPVILGREERSEDAWTDDIPTVGQDEQWRKPTSPVVPPQVPISALKRDARIANFDDCIQVTKSPVAGGILLDAMQAFAGDIPLWRDQIPELSIKVRKDGRYQRFYLVERGRTTVKPIRGKSVPIPILENFILPAGRSDYRFPLFQGDSADEVGFSARLDSPAFPLKESTECKLHLTFEYGADEPYKLVFVPLDKSIPPIRATWRRTEEITDAPAPKYPEPISWDELRSWRDAQGNEVDLREWLIYRFRKLRKNSKRRPSETDAENEKRTFFDISRRSFVNRMGVMWADGNVLADCRDDQFVREIKNSLQAVAAMKSKSQRIEVCVWQILSCLHKDAPRSCIEWLVDQVQSGHIRDPRAVGFALGDVSQQWQQDILARLVSHPGYGAISVFAYAIWRERRFVERFSISELKSLLNSLSERLAKVRPERMANNGKNAKPARRSWIRGTAEPLELLLGLLRTRASQDPEIRILLQPHQKITKQLAEQIDRIEEVIADANIPFTSRVQIDVQKPEGDHTPDLLYALRLYLTGDDGANAIHITSISDSDDD